jgi:hypothetical protein
MHCILKHDTGYKLRTIFTQKDTKMAARNFHPWKRDFRALAAEVKRERETR